MLPGDQRNDKKRHSERSIVILSEAKNLNR